MGNLSWRINVSPSGMGMHGDCPHQWYLSKVLSWGGWEKGAPERKRLAYALSKMDSTSTLAGTLAHVCLERGLRYYHDMGDGDLLVKLREFAREWLGNRYRMRSKCMTHPKQSPPIFETYYQIGGKTAPENEAWASIFESAVESIANGIRSPIFQRIRAERPRFFYEGNSNRPADSDTTIQLDYGGPDSGVVLWGKLDLLVLFDDGPVIVDWKTGKPRDKHEQQAEWYAWAGGRILIEQGIWSESDVEDPKRQAIDVVMVYLNHEGEARDESGRRLPLTVTHTLDPWDVDVERIDAFAEAVKDAPRRPDTDFEKRPGKLCDYCEMRHLCTGSRDLEVKP